MQSHIIQFKYAMIRADTNAAMYACDSQSYFSTLQKSLEFHAPEQRKKNGEIQVQC